MVEKLKISGNWYQHSVILYVHNVPKNLGLMLESQSFIDKSWKRCLNQTIASLYGLKILEIVG